MNNVAPGQIWYDASDYIPGFGEVTVIGVRGAFVVFEKFVNWTTNRERREIRLDEFLARFKRVDRSKGLA